MPYDATTAQPDGPKAQATESKMFEVIWSPMQDKYIVRKCRIFHNDPEIVGTLEQCLTWLSRIQKEA
jgi:hypothetical protein